MPRPSIRSQHWVSYGRAFLLTLGLCFLALPVWIWEQQGDQSPEWSAWAWALLYGFTGLGMFLLLVALIAPAKMVDRWAEAASSHEATIIVLLIAAPVYFVLRLLVRKKWRDGGFSAYCGK